MPDIGPFRQQFRAGGVAKRWDNLTHFLPTTVGQFQGVAFRVA
jgi:hypothetical protein